jgi:hypothetical protein
MTTQRHDGGGTKFSNWFRNQPELDSYLGYRNYNIDYVWWFKKEHNEVDKYMLLEEKCYQSTLKPDHLLMLKHLDKTLQSDPRYWGCYLIQFLCESPDDCVANTQWPIPTTVIRLFPKKIYVLDRAELIAFLQFTKRL